MSGKWNSTSVSFHLLTNSFSPLKSPPVIQGPPGGAVVLTEVAPSVDQGCNWEHLSDSCQRDVLLTSSIR